jgi:bacterioferritin
MVIAISSLSVKGEFLQHATEGQVHADQLAERIVQLGGEPNLSPEGLLSGATRNMSKARHWWR